MADPAVRAAVGRVNLAGYRSRTLCSGALVAPDLVLTAAHCVTAPDGTPLPLDDIHFVAGWDRGAHQGHGRAAAVTLHPDWAGTERGEVVSDLALIRLKAPLPQAPLATAPPAPEPVPRALAGYAATRPHSASARHPCDETARVGRYLVLACPAEGGLSGGPVLEHGPDRWRVVGVIAGGSSDMATPQTHAAGLGRAILRLIPSVGGRD
ncbi:serine protease [Rhodosalinus halophilus]|uniref:Serine protease n=2 Tax=Rhodosalinus halophilus TaxID=2259333 RepID=A0A365UE43_9RHOB|nr:serine protease [Rhodosalinus halophilus]